VEVTEKVCVVRGMMHSLARQHPANMTAVRSFTSPTTPQQLLFCVTGQEAGHLKVLTFHACRSATILVRCLVEYQSVLDSSLGARPPSSARSRACTITICQGTSSRCARHTNLSRRLPKQLRSASKPASQMRCCHPNIIRVYTEC
jgi:hypothetical protein